MTYGSGSLVGDSDSSATFDGASGDVLVGGSSSLDLTSGTVEGWFKGGTQPGGMSLHYLFGKPGVVDVYLGTGGDLQIYDNGGGGGAQLTHAVINDNAIHYIAVTFNSGVTGGTIVYLDGQRILTTTTTVSSQAYTFSIGADSANTSISYTSGTIDEVAAYSARLSPAQIQTHYTAGGGSVTSPPSTTYSRAVNTTSPLAYYRLDETSGPVAHDASGNGNGGIYSSTGVTYGAGGLVGDSDSSATFDGASGDVLVGASPSLDLTSGTVEGWFKGGTQPGGMSLHYLFGKPGVVDVYLGTGGDLQIYDNGVGGGAQLTHAVINDNAIHYIAVTFNSGVTDGTIVYLDGQRILTTTTTVSSQAYPFSIGADSAGPGSTLTAGTIDEVAVYSAKLSAAQIQAHYAAGGGNVTPPPSTTYSRAVNATSPLGYYRLDETSGPVAHDTSGSGNGGVYASSGVTYGSGSLAAGPDPAATFDGASGDVLVGASPSLDLTSGTVEGWFKGGTQPGGMSLHYLFGKPGVVDAYLGTGGDLQIYDNGVGGGAQLTHRVINDNAIHYIAVTFESGVTDGTIVYLDGSPILITTTTVGSQAHPFSIGADSASPGSTLTAGTIDDVAVYGHVLSWGQVRAHYVASGRTPEPIGGALSAVESKAGGNNFCLVCALAGLVHGVATKAPVDTESGDFYHQFVDFSVAGRGAPLAVLRTYSSSDAATDGPFGYGWQFNGGASLAVSGSSPDEVATVTQENGSESTFAEPASGTTWAPTAPRTIASLVHNGGGTWTLTRHATETLTFSSSGQLTASADLNGNTTTYGYASGMLTSITDGAGRSLGLTWTGSHITAVTDANVTPNRTVSYAYDGSGDLTDVTDVGGGDTHFVYDSSHRMTVMKDPVCEAAGAGCPGVQNDYDSSGRVDWQKDPLNRETTFAYTGDPESDAGGTTTVTDPAANVTVDGYEWGLRTYTTSGYGTAEAATTSFGYDPTTLAPTAVLDPNGNLTTMTVDASGNVLTSTDALGRVTTTTYNALNEPLTVTDANSVTTTMTYDGDGNLLTKSTPVSGSACTCQAWTYHHGDSTHPGDVTSVDDPDAKTTSYLYDTYGDQVETKDPLGNVTASVDNADGWVTATYTPKAACTWASAPPAGCSATYKTAYSYVIPGGSTTDEFGDVQTVTDPLGHVTTTGYDADRNKTSVTDANSNTTSYTYDLAGELTTTTRPDTTTLVTDYNPDGTVADQKDGKGNTTETYAYDALARVTSSTDALGNTTAFSYDGDGNTLTRTDPGGNCATPTKCTTFTYDADNEPSTTTYSDGTTPNVTSTTYDADGQKTATTWECQAEMAPL